MTRTVSGWSDWRDSRHQCPDCGWEGEGRALLVEAHAELADASCPACFEMLLIIPYPTYAETRDAADAGNVEAIEAREAARRFMVSGGSTVASMDSWYISVDIETAGPHPSAYSVLSIGACAVADPAATFYAELKPERPGADPAALAFSGLSMMRLAEEGEDPASAFERLALWLEVATPDGYRPVFVGFNAPFDWMFVADGLHRHTGRNPFGHSALDIKALEMGTTGVAWSDTSFDATAHRYGMSAALPHHALEDAFLQAELFRRILARISEGDRS